MLLTAAMIIGTGIFGALGSATSNAGSGILLAMILGGFIALATGISAAQLGVNYPEEGGAFTWAREFNHKTTGFIAGCSYLGKGIFSLCVISLAFGTYSAQLIPSLPIHVLAAIVILAVVALNFFRVELTTKVLIGLMAVNVTLLIIFTIFSSPSIRTSNFGNALGDRGIFGVLTGAAVFVWTWDGFMRTAIMAGEIKDPKRTIPFAIVGGIGIAALVFLAVGATALGVLGPNSMGKDDAPLYNAALQSIGQWGGLIILAAAWTASLTEPVGDMLSASRVAFAMGEAHELPRWLGALHPQTRIPRHAVLLIGSVVIPIALFFDLRSLLAVASLFTLVWYLITHFSALHLRENQRFTTPLFTWLGLAGCFALFLFLPLWAIMIGGLVLATLTFVRWIAMHHSSLAGD